jgi:pimeloyl-ACP methyl ester carboxylesterase
MAGPGRDGHVVLDDGRILEYWEGGDPAGRAVIYHPGTPVTRVLGRWGHDAALAAGARLVTVNRPGYGGSTTVRTPSLQSVDRDTVALARQLGLDSFAVFGSSGGGPYATATALAANGAVGALGIVGGTGPWRELEGPDVYPEDRACLALVDAGDIDGAWACLAKQVEDERSHLSALEFFEAVAAGEPSALLADERYRALWIESSQVVLDNPDGYIFDNLAWGGPWDIDPAGVSAPTLLLYGTADTRCSHDGHGAWYAERIAGSELIELPGEVHFDVIDGHWPEVLEGLLRLWR